MYIINYSKRGEGSQEWPSVDLITFIDEKDMINWVRTKYNYCFIYYIYSSDGINLKKVVESKLRKIIKKECKCEE